MTESRHIYPMDKMLGEYARAALGLGLTAIPVIFADAGAIVRIIFLSMALLFLIYGIRTAIRHRSTIEIDETGIAATGFFGRRIAWQDVKDLKLKYFATRRDRKGGWMQLSLGDGKRNLKVESQITDFEKLVETACRQAGQHGITLDDATRTNLQSIGITLPA